MHNHLQAKEAQTTQAAMEILHQAHRERNLLLRRMEAYQRQVEQLNLVIAELACELWEAGIDTNFLYQDREAWMGKVVPLEAGEANQACRAFRHIRRPCSSF